MSVPGADKSGLTLWPNGLAPEAGYPSADRAKPPISATLVGQGRTCPGHARSDARDDNAELRRYDCRHRGQCERIAAMTGRLVWLSGWPVVREWAAGIRSGLAPDVELVGLEDEIGASLPVSDESAEERRA